MKRRTDFIEIAENIPGESILPLMKIAEDNDLNIIAGSIYEQSNEGNIFNTSVVIDNFGKIIAKYRKINLFKAKIKEKRIDESEIFCAGDKSVMCEINGFKVGLSICYDLRFPELYREYFLKSVDIIAIQAPLLTLQVNCIGKSFTIASN